MKTINDYLVHKKQTGSDKWIWEFIKPEGADFDYNTPFPTFIRDIAHGGAMPNNKVFEIVADCIQSILEYNTADDARDGEPPVPVYTNEINEEVTELISVLSATFDDYKENLFIEADDADLNVTHEAHLNAYYNAVYMSLVCFLEDDGAWDSDDTQPEAA